jgi:hypothetical protein
MFELRDDFFSAAIVRRLLSVTVVLRRLCMLVTRSTPPHTLDLAGRLRDLAAELIDSVPYITDVRFRMEAHCFAIEADLLADRWGDAGVRRTKDNDDLWKETLKLEVAAAARLQHRARLQ